MLFLLRPRQAWMPFALPRDGTQQAAYRQQLDDSTTTGAPYVPPRPPSPPANQLGSLRDLGELHRTGMLSDEEFAAAKARVIADDQ